MKKCRKCGLEKNVIEFYKHAQMGDGYLSFCKICVRKRIHNFYYKDIDKNRKKEKLRYERRKKNPAFIKARTIYDKKYRSSKIRRHAIYIAKRLYKNRPDYCELCQKHKEQLSWTIHAHHPDYSKPEKVKWLCAACHRKVHLEKKEER